MSASARSASQPFLRERVGRAIGAARSTITVAPASRPARAPAYAVACRSDRIAAPVTSIAARIRPRIASPAACARGRRWRFELTSQPMPKPAKAPRTARVLPAVDDDQRAAAERIASITGTSLMHSGRVPATSSSGDERRSGGCMVKLGEDSGPAPGATGIGSGVQL
jgi:hypothetical protein